MAGQIRIDPALMRRRAQEFTNKGNDFQNLIGQMQSLVNQLDSEWEGAGKESYLIRWDDLKNNSFAKAHELIEDIAKALNSTANYYESSDGSVKF